MYDGSKLDMKVWFLEFLKRGFAPSKLQLDYTTDFIQQRVEDRSQSQKGNMVLHLIKTIYGLMIIIFETILSKNTKQVPLVSLPTKRLEGES